MSTDDTNFRELEDGFALIRRSLEEFLSAGDFNGFETIADRYCKQLEQTNRAAEGFLLLCDLLESTGALWTVQAAIFVRKQIASAIGDRRPLPPRIIERMVYLLSATLPVMQKHVDYPAACREATQLSIQGIERLYQEFDPSFDPANLPVANISPPGEGASLSGMSPESVADPAERAAYEAAISREGKKAELFRRYYDLLTVLRHSIQYSLRIVCEANAGGFLEDRQLEIWLENILSDSWFRSEVRNAFLECSK